MKTYYVKDLEKGLVINNESFAVKYFEPGTTKDGKAYYKMILIDKTGERSKPKFGMTKSLI